MKIYIPYRTRMQFGGGVTFIKNIKKGLPDVEWVDSLDKADILFVANPMMADRDDFKQAREARKKILLRLDNIPEDWNNRGTAISRLRDFNLWADKIVYQSEWSRQKYLEFGANDGTVIPNGVDTSIFKPDGDKMELPRPVITFVKSSRNENKRFPEALEMMRRWWGQKSTGTFVLQGIYSEDKKQYNFGFYNNEPYQYFPQTNSLEFMAMLYRSSDVLLFPAFADCMPNTVLEAMACGTPVLANPYGGTGEIEAIEKIQYHDLVWSIQCAMLRGREQFVDEVMKHYTLEKMCKRYRKEFDCLLTTDSN